MKKEASGEENYSSIRYPAAVFLIWIFSPIFLFSIVYFFGNVIFNQNFVLHLLIPGIFLSIISFFITKIRNKKYRLGSFYALMGALIWASPAIYFLPTSELYISLALQFRFLMIALPATVLALLFFYIGKNKAETSNNLDDLYLKRAIYNK